MQPPPPLSGKWHPHHATLQLGAAVKQRGIQMMLNIMYLALTSWPPKKATSPSNMRPSFERVVYLGNSWRCSDRRLKRTHSSVMAKPGPLKCVNLYTNTHAPDKMCCAHITRAQTHTHTPSEGPCRASEFTLAQPPDPFACVSGTSFLLPFHIL